MDSDIHWRAIYLSRTLLRCAIGSSSCCKLLPGNGVVRALEHERRAAGSKVTASLVTLNTQRVRSRRQVVDRERDKQALRELVAVLRDERRLRVQGTRFASRGAWGGCWGWRATTTGRGCWGWRATAPSGCGCGLWGTWGTAPAIWTEAIEQAAGKCFAATAGRRNRSSRASCRRRSCRGHGCF